MTTHPPRKLKLWEALALSVGLMGPTLAMGLNGPGVSATVGKAVPLVFVLGLAGVGLVGYGFWRLTRHINHAGSVYALAGATIGPRAGFFGGFALLATYLFFLVCTNAAVAVFTHAFMQQLGIADSGPWIVFAVLSAVGIALLNARDTRITARTLLVIEGDRHPGDAGRCTPLPGNLEEALQALEKDEVVTSWFDPNLVETHLAVKRAELGAVADLDPAEQCGMMARVY
jgi:hypothetical protein